MQQAWGVDPMMNLDELQQLGFFKKFKKSVSKAAKTVSKGVKKAVPVVKDVVKGTAQGLQIAGKVAGEAQQFVPKEYQGQYAEGMNTLGQAQQYANAADSKVNGLM
jgi:hypothetical protein